MKNKWISNKNPFASWEISLKKPENQQEIENLLGFTTQFLVLAGQYDMFRIDEANLRGTVRSNSEYVQQVENLIKHDNTCVFFGGLSNIKSKTPGSISHYDSNGEIVTSEVDNLGTLMVSLHGDDVEGRIFAYETSPIDISGATIDMDLSTSDEVSCWIRLHTNIWFPKVVDHLSGDLDLDVVDNTELALLHTPD